MTMKSMIRSTIQSVAASGGVYISRYQPRGVDLFADIAKYLPRLEIRTIFDVGANIGQTAAKYVEVYPAADIYSFEPVASTFATMSERVRPYPRVRPVHLALTTEVGRAAMVVDGTASETFHLASPDELADGRLAREDVALGTIDAYCAEQGIERVDLLKIDTEGNDLAVIEGGPRMFGGHIALVEVEAGMNPENSRHVPFETLKARLEHHGFRIFGIYEQVSEFPTRQPHLRRVNAVFASAATIAAN